MGGANAFGLMSQFFLVTTWERRPEFVTYSSLKPAFGAFCWQEDKRLPPSTFFLPGATTHSHIKREEIDSLVLPNARHAVALGLRALNPKP